jgi:predicted transglutaminase-like cysteine proteinase
MALATPKQLKHLALLGVALGALSSMAACATAPSAQMATAVPAPSPAHVAPSDSHQSGGPVQQAEKPADTMTLGEAAPAPLGYLRFCSRRPDQCGLDAETDGAVVTPMSEDAANKLIAKYYWSVAFANSTPSDLHLQPTSGDAADFAVATSAPIGRYDWSAIFGPTKKPSAALPPATGTAVRELGSQVGSEAEGHSSAQNGTLAPPIAQSAAAVSTDAVDTGWQFHPADFSAAAELKWGNDAFDLRVSLVERAPSQVAPRISLLTTSSASDAPVLSDAILHAPSLESTLPASQDAAMSKQEGGAQKPMVADRDAMALLDRVNQRINRAIRYLSDDAQYGADDYWTLPLEAGGSAAGDCKDYVLEKRRALIAAGIPAAQLSIAIVRTTWGEAHAVLLVSTDRGELVMDSLSSRILAWRKAPYQWIERQAPGQQLAWVKIASDRSHSTRT